MRRVASAGKKGEIETKLKKAEDTIIRLTTERQDAFDKEKKAHEENQTPINQLRRMEGLLGPPPGFRDTLAMRRPYELTPPQQEQQNIDHTNKSCFYCHHTATKHANVLGDQIETQTFEEVKVKTGANSKVTNRMDIIELPIPMSYSDETSILHEH